MIEPLLDLGPGIAGLRFTGHVTADEYRQVVHPLLEARLAEGSKIRLLVEIDDGFERFEPGAIWQDLKFGVGEGLSHVDRWERTALVADAEWARHAGGLFGWLVPGDFEVFPTAELDRAVAWLTR